MATEHMYHDSDGNDDGNKTNNRTQPTDVNDINETVQLLQQDHATMSQEERERVLSERYGNDSPIEETPELIRTSLSLMEEAIDAIEEKEAYETAMFIIPDHVTDEEFILAFLRADKFNVNAAAQRMVMYWERKVELFGKDRAFQPYLSIFDFKEEDYLTLQTGSQRVLPCHDDAGRALCFRYVAYMGSNVDSVVRVAWYTYHKALWFNERSDEIQRKGFVYLLGSGIPISDTPFNSVTMFLAYMRTMDNDMNKVLPIQTAALHVIAPTRLAFANVLVYVSRFIRLKINLYREELVDETLAALSSCGIPPECVPVELGGALMFNYKEAMFHEIVEDLNRTGIMVADEKGEYLEAIPEAIKILSLYFSET